MPPSTSAMKTARIGIRTSLPSKRETTTRRSACSVSVSGAGGGFTGPLPPWRGRSPRSSALPGTNSPTMRPRNMTRMRSAGADLVELGRDDEHADAGVARLDDALVDVFDRADVDAARRLRRDDELEVADSSRADDQLLLVAAGEVVGEAVDRGRAHVEFDDVLRQASCTAGQWSVRPASRGRRNSCRGPCSRRC